MHCYYVYYSIYVSHEIGVKPQSSRDHKGLGVAHELKKIIQKPALLFPDDNEAVLVR